MWHKATFSQQKKMLQKHIECNQCIIIFLSSVDSMVSNVSHTIYNINTAKLFTLVECANLAKKKSASQRVRQLASQS